MIVQIATVKKRWFFWQRQNQFTMWSVRSFASSQMSKHFFLVSSFSRVFHALLTISKACCARSESSCNSKQYKILHSSKTIKVCLCLANNFTVKNYFILFNYYVQSSFLSLVHTWSSFVPYLIIGVSGCPSVWSNLWIKTKCWRT